MEEERRPCHQEALAVDGRHQERLRTRPAAPRTQARAAQGGQEEEAAALIAMRRGTLLSALRAPADKPACTRHTLPRSVAPPGNLTRSAVAAPQLRMAAAWMKAAMAEGACLAAMHSAVVVRHTPGLTAAASRRRQKSPDSYPDTPGRLAHHRNQAVRPSLTEEPHIRSPASDSRTVAEELPPQA